VAEQKHTRVGPFCSTLYHLGPWLRLKDEEMVPICF